MRLRAVNYCSSFQIQLGMSHFHSQSLSSSFRYFHWTRVRFPGPQYGRIPMDYKPLPAFRSAFKKKLYSELWSIALLSKVVQTTRNWKLCWIPVCDWQLLTAVASLANQIIWTILTMIVVGLFSVLYERTVHGWRHLTRSENKVWFENWAECVGKLSGSLS